MEPMSTPEPHSGGPPPAYPPPAYPHTAYAHGSYPGGAPSDPYAGYPPGPPPMEEFHARLRELTPHVYVTWVLLAVNVLVYVAMVVRGVDFMNPGGAALLVWGADFGPSTLD